MAATQNSQIEGERQPSILPCALPTPVRLWPKARECNGLSDSVLSDAQTGSETSTRTNKLHLIIYISAHGLESESAHAHLVFASATEKRCPGSEAHLSDTGVDRPALSF